MKINKLDLTFYLFLVLFVGLHIPALSLHYFWNEAWVYAPAVITMAQEGPSLLPDAISTDLSRGHPLLFHFTYSSICKTLGCTEEILHSISLFISCLTLWCLYRFIASRCNRIIALLSAVLLMVQSVFFAQATLVLPEVLLALLTLISLQFYLDRHWKLYAISAPMGLLVKETFVVVFFSVLIFEIFQIITSKKTLIPKYFIYLIIPLLPISLFFVTQYFLHGWVFYPGHMDMVDLSLSRISGMFFDILKLIFYHHYRFLFTLSILMVIVYQYYFSKTKNDRRFQNESALLSLVIVSFILFSSINFFSVRYIILTFPLVIILGVLSIYNQSDNRLLTIILSLSILGSSIHLYKSKFESPRDVNIAFWEFVPLQKKAVDFVEELDIYDKPIFSVFTIHEYLNNPVIGYRTNETPFLHLTTWKDYSNLPEAYYVFSSLEPKNIYTSIVQSKNATLLKKYELREDWIEIYKITNQ